MPDKRDPYAEIGDTLGSLVEQNDQAGDKPAAKPGRLSPRYPSEEQRVKLSIDIDLEPSIAQALVHLAANPPDYYAAGKIRPGDLAVAAMIHGLIAFTDGDLDLTAEWTSRSRGKRVVVLGDQLDTHWSAVLDWLHIDRWPDDSASAPDPTPPADRWRSAGGLLTNRR